MKQFASQRTSWLFDEQKVYPVRSIINSFNSNLHRQFSISFTVASGINGSTLDRQMRASPSILVIGSRYFCDDLRLPGRLSWHHKDAQTNTGLSGKRFPTKQRTAEPRSKRWNHRNKGKRWHFTAFRRMFFPAMKQAGFPAVSVVMQVMCEAVITCPVKFGRRGVWAIFCSVSSTMTTVSSFVLEKHSKHRCKLLRKVNELQLQAPALKCT